MRRLIFWSGPIVVGVLIPILLALFLGSPYVQKLITILSGLTLFSLAGYFFLLMSAKKGKWQFLALFVIFVFPGSFIICFAMLYKVTGLLINGELIQAGWWEALYFSMVTWTTLGYGDYQPTHDIQLYSAVEGYLGYFFSGLAIAALVRIIDEMGFRLRS